MSDKKRKRVSESHETLPPQKKLATEQPAPKIKVSIVQDGGDWAPILASSPGLSLSGKTRFKAYQKPRTSRARNAPANPELLLHSDTHPKLDYTASEEGLNGAKNILTHYIGVYDEKRESLQLVPAQKLVVRGTLKTARSVAVDDQKPSQDKGPTNNRAARNELGLAFGTKKSQKAIKALTANAIQVSPSKNKSGSGGPTLDPVANAVVSSMASAAASMPSREEMQAEVESGKPRPKPNLQAEAPADVYSVEQLVGGEHTLRKIGVKGWIDRTKADENVQVRSRFVANRMKRLVEIEDVKKIRLLKYILLLIEWKNSLETKPKQIKKVPKLEKMESMVQDWGNETLLDVERRFAEDHQLNKWHQDNLLTHILAMSLTVDNFVSDTHDIREDLKLEAREIAKYYAELGCQLTLPTEKERKVLNLTVVEARAHKVARLKLPLVFPKMKVPIKAKRK